MSLQLENTPCPLSPLPLASKGSDQFVDNISDIDDLDSDDDLSPILDAMTVSSNVLNIIYLMLFHPSLDYSNSPKLCRRQKSHDTS